MAEPPIPELTSDSQATLFSQSPSPNHPTPQVGFIGLGNIGYAMAKNLAQQGPAHISNLPAIMVWNRTTTKAEQLVSHVGTDKAQIAKSAEQIALECDVIIVNLANDDVVRMIYHRLTEALKKQPPIRNKIFVETSTIYPSLAGELDAMISSLPHTHLITCPVLGTPLVADKSQLLLIMSGDYRSKKEVAHLLVPSVGRKVIDLGGDLEKALTYKLTANAMILGNLEILAEAFTFAEKSGIGSKHVYDLLQDFFPAPSILGYADKMLNEKFDGTNGFSIDGGIKDATHIRRLTAKYNCPMPAIDVAHQHLLTARALHLRKKNEGKGTVDILDWSGIIAGTRSAAGLNGFDKRQDTSLAELEEV